MNGYRPQLFPFGCYLDDLCEAISYLIHRRLRRHP